jgi:hypothetical protein|tara:strand:+ start:1471 stop:1635 length:165 start_codon:yes stop_codon:yes gene_type:complete
MKKLSFYDLKKKKKFTSDKYKLVTKTNKRTKLKMKFAVAQAPSGIPAWRILGKA